MGVVEPAVTVGVVGVGPAVTVGAVVVVTLEDCSVVVVVEVTTADGTMKPVLTFR
ncbi:MAG: hypothetical protein WC632_05345 [Candidatus Margulisiibacteriota bacterium]